MNEVIPSTFFNKLSKTLKVIQEVVLWEVRTKLTDELIHSLV